MAMQLDARIDTRTHALALEQAAHRLTTNQGDLGYSRLVLALGADPIRL